MRESIELIRRDYPASFYENTPSTISLAGIDMWCNRVEHGAAIRAIRCEAGLTIPEAAKATGFSTKQFERWESGETVPREATVGRVAIGLDVPLLPLVMNISSTEEWERWGQMTTDAAGPDGRCRPPA